jgi:hypothetical protein
VNDVLLGESDSRLVGYARQLIESGAAAGVVVSWQLLALGYRTFTEHGPEQDG